MRRRTVVMLALALGALILAAAGQTWVEATGLHGGSTDSARASGSSAAPVATAMAVVVLAGALALTTARRVGAVVIAALLALAGVLTAVTAVAAALDPTATAAAAVSAATGTTAPAAAYAVTAWPWVCAVAGALAAALGAATLLWSRGWHTARRYDTSAQAGAAAAQAPAAGGGTTGHVDEMDAWDELSRGNDPT